MKLLSLLFATLLLAPAVQAEQASSVWDPEAGEAQTEQKLAIKVYRSEQCGCCKDWITHLKKHDFEVEDIVSDNMSKIKQDAGLPVEMVSCHTGIIEGYVIEGHVPAQDIKKLVATKPDIAGLSVPQMPHGTPGMETGRKDDFHVVAFDKQGELSIFNVYQDY